MQVENGENSLSEGRTEWIRIAHAFAYLRNAICVIHAQLTRASRAIVCATHASRASMLRRLLRKTRV